MVDQAPDADISTTDVVVNPDVNLLQPKAADPPPAVDPSDPAEPVDPADDPVADPPAHGNKGKPPWFMERITESTHRARQAEEERDAARREAREAKELLARIQRGDKTDTAPPQPQRADDADLDTRVAQRVYEQNVNQIVERGRRAVGRDVFDEASKVIMAVAGDRGTPEIVNAVYNIDPDNAHLILHQLGTNPETLADLASMNPVQKIAAITRMSMTAPKAEPKPEPSKAPPTKVSRAPAPPPPVDPGTTKIVDWKSHDGDKLSDDEWSKKWNEDAKARRAAR